MKRSAFTLVYYLAEINRGMFVSTFWAERPAE